MGDVSGDNHPGARRATPPESGGELPQTFSSFGAGNILFVFSHLRELWVMFQEITTPAFGAPPLLDQEGSYPKYFRPLGLET
jgi:hypothetical protein